MVKGCFCKLCLPLEIVLYVNRIFARENLSRHKKMDGNFRWELNLWRIQGQKNWNVILFLEIQVISSDSWNEQTNFIFVKFYWEYILFPKQRHTFVQSNDEKISIMLIKHRSSVLEFFFLVWNINKRSAVCLKATKLHQKINVLSANDVLKRGSWHANCVNFVYCLAEIQCSFSVESSFCENGSLAKNSTHKKKIVP